MRLMYWWVLIQRAWSDAWDFAGSWPGALTFIFAILLGAWVWRKERQGMKERFYRVLAGIAAPMAFWIFVLGFNLFFLTPKRMYEDKVKEVEKTRLESQSIHYTVRPMAS